MIKEQLENVIKEVSEITGIDILKTRSRRVEVVDAKVAASNFMRKYYGTSMQLTADVLKYTNHTTILHHERDHESRYRFRPQYADVYDELCNRCVSRNTAINVNEIMNLMKELT